MGRWIAGAGHPRPAGKAAEERVAELLATTATPPAGMRGPRAQQSYCRGLLSPLGRIRGGSQQRDYVGVRELPERPIPLPHGAELGRRGQDHDKIGFGQHRRR